MKKSFIKISSILILNFYFFALRAQAQALPLDDSLKNIFSLSDPTLSKLRVMRRDWEKADSAFKFAKLYWRANQWVEVMEVELKNREMSSVSGYSESWMKHFTDAETYNIGLCKYIEEHTEGFPGITVCNRWPQPFLVVSIHAFISLADSTEEEEDDAFCTLLELAYGEFNDKTEIGVSWKTKYFDGTCNSLFIGDGSVTLLLKLASKILESSSDFDSPVIDLLDQLANDIYNTPYYQFNREKVLEEFQTMMKIYPLSDLTEPKVSEILRKVISGSEDLHYDAAQHPYTCD